MKLKLLSAAALVVLITIPIVFLAVPATGRNCAAPAPAMDTPPTPAC